MRFKKNWQDIFPRNGIRLIFLKKIFSLFFSGLDKIKNLFIINTELRKRLTEC